MSRMIRPTGVSAKVAWQLDAKTSSSGRTRPRGPECGEDRDARPNGVPWLDMDDWCEVCRVRIRE